MFTHTKLKDVDTIISQCVRSRTNDGNYLKKLLAVHAENWTRSKKKEKKKGNSRAYCVSCKRNNSKDNYSNSGNINDATIINEKKIRLISQGLMIARRVFC